MARASQEDEGRESFYVKQGQTASRVLPDLVLSLSLRAPVRRSQFLCIDPAHFTCFRMSYGTGRPAILKDDESIWQCRLLLQHPLAIEDDMRLVSTVELMAIRERVHNNLAPLFDRAVDEITFNVLREADMEFRNWYATWDQAFSQKYEDAGTFHPLFLRG